MSSIARPHRPSAGRLILLGALLATALTVVFASSAAAHERREVGEYSVLVGFMVEPAFEGEMNGVDFRVNAGDADGDPVTGVEATVQAEVTHVDSGVSAVLELRALFGQPGRYTADLAPTASGPYQLRFFGSINGTEIDETFVSYSLGGGFNDVRPVADVQFPETVASGRELQGAVTGARDAALAAEDAADSARTLAITGIAVGAIGIIVGGAGLGIGLRRR